MNFQSLKIRLIREIENLQDQALIEELLLTIQEADKKEKREFETHVTQSKALNEKWQCLDNLSDWDDYFSPDISFRNMLRRLDSDIISV